uniref:Uncharacterized protein n=1 Tax=Anabas testudineus TaxID=64144 RepID=A0A3Q1IVM1_ANATE
MQRSLEALVRLLESYRGRDKVVRRCVMAPSLLEEYFPVRQKQMLRSSVSGKVCYCFQLNSANAGQVLRLFDDLSMLAYSHSYGFGAEEEDSGVRWISVVTNMADQLYYPCEHIAWAADAELIRVKSDKWWLFSTVLWGTSLLLGILRWGYLSTKVGAPFFALLAEYMQVEVLSILSSMADLSNAIHWMPPGFLWAGRFPNWLVGLMGTISSLIGLMQMNAGNSDQSDNT